LTRKVWNILRDMFEELAFSASFFLILLFWAVIALIFIAGFIWVKAFKNSSSED